MSNQQIGSLITLLLLLLASAHLLGLVFARLRQPRVVGEILGGVLVGPSVLGHFFGWTTLGASVGEGMRNFAPVLDFVYWLGLLLLMFLSGSETRGLFAREDRKQVSWLAAIGTGLPFIIGLIVAPMLPLDRLSGIHSSRASLVLVIGIAVAVTSIPVISKIFADLNILQTRFARLVLGVAMLEDIALWAVLAIATAMAGAKALSVKSLTFHVAATIIYFVLGLTLMPRLLKPLSHTRWNVLAHGAPLAYLIAVLFAFGALAGAFDISLVFAAFLAGFAIVKDKRKWREANESLRQVSFGLFIPLYFAMVGYRLDLTKTFSFSMLAVFLFGACLVKLLSVAMGARFAGFRGLDVWNLAIATNARGGPGIVLASVAFDAGIINAAFYTTLVIVAVLTSQVAGAWLDFVIRKGWPLLRSEANVQPVVAPIVPVEPHVAA